ncbi:MAG: hypothetical protein IJ667_13405 [Synergistaceae bacterium]|nr:hypothetical protein [Synergistaceae bacterium]
MCVTLAAGLAAAGGLFGAAGSIMQGRAQAKAYEQQAKIANHNARLAQLQGVRELEKGAREEQRFRRKARQFQSSQRSLLAASGLQQTGSVLNVLSDTSSGIEEDASMIRFNTLQNKWQRDAQAVNFMNEASAMRANASNAKTAGYMGGLTTLLGTGLQVAGMTAKPLGGGNVASTTSNSIKINSAWQYNEAAQGINSYNPFDVWSSMAGVNRRGSVSSLYDNWFTRQNWGYGY